MTGKVPSRVLHAAVSVKFLQIKLLDQFVLHRSAREDADKDVARALEAKEIGRDSSQPARVTRHRGNRCSEARCRLTVWRHQPRCGLVSSGDEKSCERTRKQSIHSDSEQQPAVFP